MTRKKYAVEVSRVSPKSEKAKMYLNAFLVGGLVCSIGQAFFEMYTYFGINEETVKSLVPVTLIFIAALLTGLKVFDNISKFAGAGILVPITGFANSVTAPAIEFKHEGFITGTAVNMFKIAGPVIVYGMTAGVIYGIVYFIFTR